MSLRIKIGFAFLVGFLVLALPAIAEKSPPERPHSSGLRHSNATVERDSYVAKTESRLKDYDEKISDLKTERDREAKNTARFHELDRQVSKLEKQVQTVRENLADLRNSLSKHWAKYEQKIESELSKLEQTIRQAD